jgi:hypothetical protein
MPTDLKQNDRLEELQNTEMGFKRIPNPAGRDSGLQKWFSED